MTAVFLVSHDWTQKGHGGVSNETDYEVFLGRMRLRGYSTHGNMEEGYWGSSAKAHAERYAAEVAEACRCRVFRAKRKRA